VKLLRLLKMVQAKKYIITIYLTLALEYTISKIEAIQEGLKLNGMYQHLLYAGDINILVGSMRTLKKNGEALITASKEVSIEVYAEKSKNMVVLRTACRTIVQYKDM
jgi:hypothetical protein